MYIKLYFLYGHQTVVIIIFKGEGGIDFEIFNGFSLIEKLIRVTFLF